MPRKGQRPTIHQITPPEISRKIKITNAKSMAGGIGFARDAQASFERNRAMRGGKGPFKRAEDNKFIGKKRKQKVPKYNEMSPTDLAIFSAQLKIQRKRRLAFEIIGGIILTVLFFAGLWWLFF